MTCLSIVLFLRMFVMFATFASPLDLMKPFYRLMSLFKIRIASL